MSTSGKKIKHSVKRIPFFFLQALKRIGIRITPLFTVNETITADGLDDGGFRMGFEGPEHVDEIVAVEPVNSPDEIVDWFKEGKLCYGVRDEGRLIAKMWCDLEAFQYPMEDRRLEPGEAFLYAACVLPEYRGQNLAVLMRARCRDALEEMGINRLYSCTFYFNYPARRFKEKLGCRNQSLQIYVELFGRWKRLWTVKRYGQPSG